MPVADARALLKKYGLHAKKSWGQNFLVEERAYRAIVEACAIEPGDWVIEVGAGLGTLTARLAEAGAHVVAIERDRDLAALLRSEHGSDPRIELHEANALTFDYAAAAALAPRPPTVVGNLPYQIASPILFRLFDVRAALARVVVMLQREMVDRIVAPPATAAYGALSAMVRLFGEARLVARVRAGAFVPPPRVDSAVLRVELFPGGATRVAVRSVEWYSQVVHAAFNQRRKMLRNALGGLAEPAALERAFTATGIDPQRRGETLSVEEFAALAEALGA